MPEPGAMYLPPGGRVAMMVLITAQLGGGRHRHARQTSASNIVDCSFDQEFTGSGTSSFSCMFAQY